MYNIARKITDSIIDNNNATGNAGMQNLTCTTAAFKDDTERKYAINVLCNDYIIEYEMNYYRIIINCSYY